MPFREGMQKGNERKGEYLPRVDLRKGRRFAPFFMSRLKPRHTMRGSISCAVT